MIRFIKEQDFESVYTLGEYLHSNYRNIYPLDKMLKEPYFHVIVYEENNSIIGFLSYIDLNVTMDILDVVVHKDYRRQKVATNLIDYAITSATAGCSMFIEVDTKNQSAIKLYQKFGFEIIGTRDHYYGENDAYVMERVI